MNPRAFSPRRGSSFLEPAERAAFGPRKCDAENREAASVEFQKYCLCHLTRRSTKDEEEIFIISGRSREDEGADRVADWAEINANAIDARKTVAPTPPPAPGAGLPSRGRARIRGRISAPCSSEATSTSTYISETN